MAREADVTQGEGICPKCHHTMQKQHLGHYYCPTCQQDYDESYRCPTCGAPLSEIKGCGAINYLCRTDGLVSSSKIIFHYQQSH